MSLVELTIGASFFLSFFFPSFVFPFRILTNSSCLHHTDTFAVSNHVCNPNTKLGVWRWQSISGVLPLHMEFTCPRCLQDWDLTIVTFPLPVLGWAVTPDLCNWHTGCGIIMCFYFPMALSTLHYIMWSAFSGKLNVHVTSWGYTDSFQ